MEVSNQLIDLHELLKPFIQKVPKSVTGIERHLKIADIIEQQSDEFRMQLRQIIDFYLEEMIRLEASDIDLGGPGCDGKVWYRVYGE